MVLALRSLAFQVAFFVNLAVFLIVSLPALAMPRRFSLACMRAWALSSDWLLAAICGLRHEVRGAEHLPAGAALVASKHQSAWETIALMHILRSPAVVLKRELLWLPLFGLFAIRIGHLPVDRGGKGAALRNLLRRARLAVLEGRPVVIFPEGTRRPPGAPPAYQSGIAALYRDLGVPCVPIALNSGHFWARRDWRRRPGVIVVDVLEPIPPGLPGRAFLAELERRIETASARLYAETEAGTAAQAPPIGIKP